MVIKEDLENCSNCLHLANIHRAFALNRLPSECDRSYGVGGVKHCFLRCFKHLLCFNKIQRDGFFTECFYRTVLCCSNNHLFMKMCWRCGDDDINIIPFNYLLSIFTGFFPGPVLNKCVDAFRVSSVYCLQFWLN